SRLREMFLKDGMDEHRVGRKKTTRFACGTPCCLAWHRSSGCGEHHAHLRPIRHWQGLFQNAHLPLDITCIFHCLESSSAVLSAYTPTSVKNSSTRRLNSAGFSK